MNRPMATKQTNDSFWAKVDVQAPDRCWNWQGAINNSGYGTCSWHGTVYTAHRIAAWIEKLVKSPAAPKDRTSSGFVLHTCDNPKCCNPNHFQIGTYADNQKQAYVRKRRSAFNGESHKLAKLSNKQAQKIRSLYAAKHANQSELAKLYKVSQRTISLIVRRKSYVCK
jgi:hypothetical protein